MIEFTSGGILGLEFSLSENFKWQIQFFNNNKDICLLPQWRLLQLLTFNTPWKEFRVESEALLPQGNWWNRSLDQFSSVPLSDWLTVSQSPVWTLQPHGLQHTRPPYPSPSARACSNSCPLSRWCHPTISSSVIPFSSCLQSFPASGSFPVSQFFASGGQSIGVSASTSVLPMNIQDWSPLEWTGWISLQSKGLSRVFSNTTVQKHQLFGAQLSL